VYLLDSDHLTILWYDHGKSYETLISRIADHSDDEFAVSIVTIEEQLRGWLAYVAKASAIEGAIKGYSKLREVIDRFREINVLDFDSAAAGVFIDLKSQGVRVGTMDLRIAATCNFLCPTCNLQLPLSNLQPATSSPPTSGNCHDH